MGKKVLRSTGLDHFKKHLIILEKKTLKSSGLDSSNLSKNRFKKKWFHKFQPVNFMVIEFRMFPV